MTTALEIAARRDHDLAVWEAIRFCEDDPSYSFEYGKALIAALGNAGDYPAALRFVLAEEKEGDLGENGGKWITELFNAWAQKDPRAAWQTACTSLPDGYREEALQVVGAAWLRDDPSALANFVGKSPPGEPSPLVCLSLSNWGLDTGSSTRAN